jgi:hypothetical protein
VKASVLIRHSTAVDLGINMQSDGLKIREAIRIATYRNTPVTEWVNKAFRTELEKCAAWSMFSHICNEYPECQNILRGELIETDEY